jgi:hypothetical protein
MPDGCGDQWGAYFHYFSSGRWVLCLIASPAPNGEIGPFQQDNLITVCFQTANPYVSPAGQAIINQFQDGAARGTGYQLVALADALYKAGATQNDAGEIADDYAVACAGQGPNATSESDYPCGDTPSWTGCANGYYFNPATETCQPLVPIIHPTGPTSCPPGTARNLAGQCVKPDPPTPVGVTNISGPTKFLNPTLRGAPSPFAMTGCGCGEESDEEVTVDSVSIVGSTESGGRHGQEHRHTRANSGVHTPRGGPARSPGVLAGIGVGRSGGSGSGAPRPRNNLAPWR